MYVFKCIRFSVGLPVHNEDQVASNVLAFLRGFYAKHPHYRPLPLYLFGESYVPHSMGSTQEQRTAERGRNKGFFYGGLMSLCDVMCLLCGGMRVIMCRTSGPV
jgi:hypothetical protein